MAFSSSSMRRRLQCIASPAKLTSVKTWKLTLEYDGTKYSGWQEQINARTVMGELRKAAEGYFGGAVELHGSGRTDAGVHALAQVAHLRTAAKVTRHVDAIRRE